MLIEEYEISSETYAIIPENKKTSKIISSAETIIMDKSVREVLRYNCRYYGSSLTGRIEASKYALGMKYKLPIIVEETRELIFFPTNAVETNRCSWISLNNILKNEKCEDKSKIIFSNGLEIILNISFSSLENQIFRAMQLLLILKKRKS